MDDRHLVWNVDRSLQNLTTFVDQGPILLLRLQHFVILISSLFSDIIVFVFEFSQQEVFGNHLHFQDLLSSVSIRESLIPCVG